MTYFRKLKHGCSVTQLVAAPG